MNIQDDNFEVGIGKAESTALRPLPTEPGRQFIFDDLKPIVDLALKDELKK